MDEETVERVARALFDVEWKDHGGEAEFESSKDYWLKSARAAIAAMQSDPIPIFATTEGPKETFQGKRK
jgi:hypothetical protein